MGFVRAAVFTSIVAIGGAAYVYRADVMREVGPYLGMAPAKAAETQASPAAGAQPQGRRGRANPGGAVPVVIMPVTSQAMPVVVDAVGTVQSIASVQIKPRMDSQIMKVNVEEGALVKEGDVLFELDSRALKAQLGQIEAQIRKDQAQVVQARRDLQRTEELLAKNAGTVVQRDNAGTAVKAAEAQLEADEAAKASVQTSLTFTEIRAPVSGRIGSIANKAGAVVRTGDNSAASTLATINQIDPIYVSFAIPQVILPDLRAAMAKGPVTVSAIVDDSKKQSGVMAFIENTVDPNTGTVTAKARIGNANELLWPGQFVKVEIVLGIEPRRAFRPFECGPARFAGTVRVRDQGWGGRTQAGFRQAHPGRTGRDRQGARERRASGRRRPAPAGPGGIGDGAAPDGQSDATHSTAARLGASTGGET